LSHECERRREKEGTWRREKSAQAGRMSACMNACSQPEYGTSFRVGLAESRAGKFESLDAKRSKGAIT
jgi:hypothetical protein